MTGSDFDFWLLDLDGTLVDVEESYVHRLLADVGSEFGISFTAREAESLWYGYGDSRTAVLAEYGIDAERFWEVFHAVEQPDARAAATHLYPDAEAFVPELSAPVGLVTHCQAFLTAPVLDRLDIADWFDTVLCCTDETGWKPSPGPVNTAMQELGVAHNGHEGVLVGDDPGDVGAARNAGITSIHVDRHGSNPPLVEPRPDRQVETLAQLDR
jgi:phosphoglycolate phosphatase